MMVLKYLGWHRTKLNLAIENAGLSLYPAYDFKDFSAVKSV